VKISPLDIRRKEFKRSVRGYLEEDVDVFLDEVADEVERLSKENSNLEERLQALEQQVAGHSHIREALEKTLVAAQLQSEEIRSKAEQESQSIVQEAETKAREVVDDLYGQTRKVQQTLMQLKLLEEDFRFKFKALLGGYLQLVEDGPILLSGLQRDMRVAGAPEMPEDPQATGVGPGTSEDATSETVEASALVAEEEQVRGVDKKGKKATQAAGDGAKARKAADEPSSGQDRGDAEGSASEEDGPSGEARDFRW